MGHETEDSLSANGDSVNIRRDREKLIHEHDKSISEATADNSNADTPKNIEDVTSDETKLANLTVAQYNQLNQFLLSSRSDLDIPSRDQIADLALLREQVPEIYHAFIDAFNRNSEADYLERTEPMKIAREYSRRGQYIGLVAVLLTLGIVAFAIVSKTYWIAGILGTLDLVALAAVFGASNSPTRSGDEKRDTGDASANK